MHKCTLLRFFLVLEENRTFYFVPSIPKTEKFSPRTCVFKSYKWNENREYPQNSAITLYTFWNKTKCWRKTNLHRSYHFFLFVPWFVCVYLSCVLFRDWFPFIFLFCSDRNKHLNKHANFVQRHEIVIRSQKKYKQKTKRPTSETCSVGCVGSLSPQRYKAN